MAQRQKQKDQHDAILEKYEAQLKTARQLVHDARIEWDAANDGEPCPECGAALVVGVDGKLRLTDSEEIQTQADERYTAAKEQLEVLESLSRDDLPLPTIDDEPNPPLAQDYLKETDDLKQLRGDHREALGKLRQLRLNERENVSAINHLNSEIDELKSKIDLADDIDENERQISFQQREIEDATTKYDKEMVALTNRVENTRKSYEDLQSKAEDYSSQEQYLRESKKMAQLYLDAHEIAKEIEIAITIEEFTSTSGYRARRVKSQLKPLFERFAELAAAMDLKGAVVETQEWTGQANGVPYEMLSTSERLCFRLALRLAILEVHDIPEKFIFIDELNAMDPVKLKHVLVNSGAFDNVRAITAYATNDVPVWLDGEVWEKLPCN